MSDPVHLVPMPVRNRRSVIETLEEVLAEAREGRVTAVAIGLVRPWGAINSAASNCDDIGRVVGALELAKLRILTP